jgi:hypothetical protein
MPEKRLKHIPIFGVDITPDTDKPKPKQSVATDAPPQRGKKPPKAAFIGE